MVVDIELFENKENVILIITCSFSRKENEYGSKKTDYN